MISRCHVQSANPPPPLPQAGGEIGMNLPTHLQIYRKAAKPQSRKVAQRRMVIEKNPAWLCALCALCAFDEFSRAGFAVRDGRENLLCAAKEKLSDPSFWPPPLPPVQKSEVTTQVLKNFVTESLRTESLRIGIGCSRSIRLLPFINGYSSSDMQILPLLLR